MFFASFRLRQSQWLVLALSAFAYTGCTLDFDRFTPVASSAPADAGVGPELEAASGEDGITTSIDSTDGVDSESVTDADLSGPADAVADAPARPGDAVADAPACTEARSVTIGG